MSIELPSNQLRRRRELTVRLQEGIITIQEAQELKGILEMERQQAEATNDFIAIFAIAGLLLLLAAILPDEGKQKKKKSRRLFIFPL
ncbi:MAG: hypothetical protein WCF03_15445 [Nitrososphaeraceae archaeon]